MYVCMYVFTVRCLPKHFTNRRVNGGRSWRMGHDPNNKNYGATHKCSDTGSTKPCKMAEAHAPRTNIIKRHWIYHSQGVAEAQAPRTNTQHFLIIANVTFTKGHGAFFTTPFHAEMPNVSSLKHTSCPPWECHAPSEALPPDTNSLCGTTSLHHHLCPLAFASWINGH